MTLLIEIGGRQIDVEQQLFVVRKRQCELSLVEFIKQAWHVVEPGQPYIHGWHIDFICTHLEAITDGVTLDTGDPYNRLLINIPPGTMKSLITNVFWPAWEWGPRNMPHLRYVCAAHKVENLSARDSRRMRMLVTSEWYAARWGDRVNLARDQNEKLNFQNTANGFRIATAITSLTGMRGDRVIIDDPHSVDSAASDAQRLTEVTTFLEAIPTRLNNPETSAIVVIMQRLHQEDVSGVIIDKQLGYDHIMLPMRYDPVRAMPTALGVEDPRQTEGELLFPQRFPEKVVDRDERAIGPYATAGQFQQEPTPRGGGIIKREWWQTWEEAAYPAMDYVIASLDTAYTEKQENDASALTVWGIFSSDTNIAAATKVQNHDGTLGQVERIYNEGAPRAMLMAAWQDRLELPDLVEKVITTCRRMRVDTLLIEAKASGISVAQEIRRLNQNEGWGVELINPGATDKMARLYSVQHLFTEGMIYAPDRTWADMVIDQVAVFPKGKHDDLCFVAGTMIEMGDGTFRPIETVRVGDLVSTPYGAREVSAAACTGVHETWSVEYDGGAIEGTPNHPVMVDGKWVPIELIKPGEMLLSPYQSITGDGCHSKKRTSSLNVSSLMGACTGDTQIPPIPRTGDILVARATACIETFGNFIMAPFLTAIRSIISMETRPTTTYQISSAYHSRSTETCTLMDISSAAKAKNRSGTYLKSGGLPLSGTKAKRGENGTDIMSRTRCGVKALQSLTQRVLMKVFANGVEQLSNPEAEKSCSVAQDALKRSHVTREVFSVRSTLTMRPVFNLTVDGAHCYYANGILVHNCDTVSMALKTVRERGLLVRAPERLAELDAGRQHRGRPPAPLYPS